MLTRRKLVEEFDPSADHRTYTRRSGEPVPKEPIRIVPIINKTLHQCERQDKRAYMPPSRPGGDRAKFCVHPSQSSGCRRQVQFVLLDAKRDNTQPDPRKWRIFDIGHESHRRIQGYLFEAWKRRVNNVTRVWEDVKLRYDALMVLGELDAIVEVNGVRVVVEVKTMSKGLFEKMAVPKVSWVWQAHLYMKAVGLASAILLVENRDNAQMREFWVPFDQKVWDQIEFDTLEVLVDTEDAKVSRANPDPGDCMWCNYTTLCKSVPMQRKIDFERVWAA